MRSVLALIFLACVQAGRIPWTDDEHPLLKYMYPEFSTYDKALRPDYGEKATKVEVNIYFREIGPINIDKDELELQMTFRQIYLDPRLKHDSPMSQISLVGDESKKVWQPDTFFRYGRSTKIMETFGPNQMARVTPDGTVMLSTRILHTAACLGLREDLENAGVGSCSIQIASYGFDTSDLEYHWKEEEPIKISEKRVYLGQGVTYEGFDLDTSSVRTSTAEYGMLTIKLNFKKE